MKKTMVMMAALMLMAGSAMACAQQPEKKDVPETTETQAPAEAAGEQEKAAEDQAEKSDSTTAEPAKEECKASAGTGEGCSSAASEKSAPSAE